MSATVRYEGDKLVSKPRPLWQALAHCWVNLRIGDPMQDVLVRVYGRLRLSHKILCRNEIRQCREAMRGQREAKVS